MYKKAVSGLALLNLILLFGILCVEGIALNRQKALPVSSENTEEYIQTERRDSALGIAETVISGQRTADVEEIQKSKSYPPAYDDLEILLRIVEAEAGNQDEEGRLLVANVVLNRVNSAAFPDNVRDVVLQNQQGTYQFSPVKSGRIWKVKVSDTTKRAVERALAGEDISDGALYFAARKKANGRSMKWFDEHLTFLFQHGGHEFFR